MGIKALSMFAVIGSILFMASAFAQSSGPACSTTDGICKFFFNAPISWDKFWNSLSPSIISNEQIISDDINQATELQAEDVTAQSSQTTLAADSSVQSDLQQASQLILSIQQNNPTEDVSQASQAVSLLADNEQQLTGQNIITTDQNGALVDGLGNPIMVSNKNIIDAATGDVIVNPIDTGGNSLSFVTDANQNPEIISTFTPSTEVTTVDANGNALGVSDASIVSGS